MRTAQMPARVMDTADIILRAALVGIGGTIVLDLYAFLMQRMFGVPTNWKMVGRWLGRMSKGEFVQTNIGQAEPVPGEHALGWTFHYVIGIAYGLLLVAIWGAGWLRQPGIAEPLILAFAARPALFRDDAGHGYGNGWIEDAQAQCDPAEERDRPLHVRHRHVSDRQAYGSCWLSTADRSINWVHSIQHFGERRVEQSQSLFLSFNLAAESVTRVPKSKWDLFWDRPPGCRRRRSARAFWSKSANYDHYAQLALP
jgi:hypothetical protein